MLNAILGRKLGQSQRFTESGKRITVTVIEAGPCPVVQIKRGNHDGYWAVQLGFGQLKTKRTNQSILGKIKKAGLKKTPRFLREIRLEKEENLEKLGLGNEIKVSKLFEVGDKVQVTGISKGKGFAGVVKRWGFAGGPRTRGQSDRERAPGSIGQTTTPGRVFKGKKMAGRMGGKKTTIKGLQVIKIDGERNRLMIKGLVPGARNSLLIIKKIGKIKNFIPLYQEEILKDKDQSK